MSEEEKKAIIELNHYNNITAYWKQEEYTNSEIDNYIKTVLNLIQKQEKVLNDIKQEVFNYNESIKLNDTLNNDNFRSAYVIIKKIENYLRRKNK